MTPASLATCVPSHPAISGFIVVLVSKIQVNPLYIINMHSPSALTVLFNPNNMVHLLAIPLMMLEVDIIV